jgi:hypothetical protein
MRETFAMEERANHRGWDRLPITVIQYLHALDAPSSVATVQARLGTTPEAVRFLIRSLRSDEPDASWFRESLIQDNVLRYLGCAIAYEGYSHPLHPEEHARRSGDQQIADLPGVEEFRAIRGVTTQGRRFVVIRRRGDHQGVEDVVFAQLDFPCGDGAYPHTELNVLATELNTTLRESYANRRH